MSKTSIVDYTRGKAEELSALTLDEYVRLIKLHDSYNKHVPMEWHTYGYPTICKDCLMPIRTMNSDGDKWAVVVSGRGGMTHSTSNYMETMHVYLGDAMYVKATAAMLEMGSIGNLFCRKLGGPQQALMLGVLRQYLNPIFCNKRGMNPNSMPDVALGMGLLEGPMDDTRNTASRTPVTALMYAQQVDKNMGHPATRVGASKHAGNALLYAIQVDRHYSEVTLAGVLKNLEASFDYLNAFRTSQAVQDAFFAKWITGSESPDAIKRYLKSCPRDPRVTERIQSWEPEMIMRAIDNVQAQHSDAMAERVGQSPSPEDAIKYFRSTAVNHPKIEELACTVANTALRYAELLKNCNVPTSDKLRTATCRTASDACEYAEMVDRKPDTETRNATATMPYIALRYAERVDHGAHDVTRASACKHSETAFRYARMFGHHPDLRAAALMHPKYACMYAKEIDKKPSPDAELVAGFDLDASREYAQFKQRWEETHEPEPK